MDGAFFSSKSLIGMIGRKLKIILILPPILVHSSTNSAIHRESFGAIRRIVYISPSKERMQHIQEMK
jgi:hypothetical protein